MIKNLIPFGRKKKPESQNSHSVINETEKKKIEGPLSTEIFLDGDTILSDPEMSSLISKIRVSVGVDDKYFDAYYAPVLRNVAAYCQSASASEGYHHTYPFGLIIHLLEVTLYSLRARLQFIYTATGLEEEIDEYKNIYTYAVFLAGIHHDLGKAISDLRYSVRVSKDAKFVNWCPLSSMPPSEDMMVEYRINRKVSKSTKKPIYKYNSHSIVNVSLLCRTVPKQGFDWIVSVHPKIETDLYHAIAGDYDQADAIGKSVKAGDMQSTDLGKSNVESLSLASNSNAPTTLEGKIQVAIHEIFSEPNAYDLSVNNERFTAIVKADEKIYVSGIALEGALRKKFKGSPDALPAKSVNLESVITQQLTLPSPSGDSMWWCKFSKKGAEVDKKKKDIKCFVFDASIYDPNDILPEANNLTVHLAISSMSEDDKKTAVSGANKIKMQENLKSIREDMNDTGHDVDVGGKTNSSLDALGQTGTSTSTESIPSNGNAQETAKNEQNKKSGDDNVRKSIGLDLINELASQKKSEGKTLEKNEAPKKDNFSSGASRDYESANKSISNDLIAELANKNDDKEAHTSQASKVNKNKGSVRKKRKPSKNPKVAAARSLWDILPDSSNVEDAKLEVGKNKPSDHTASANPSASSVPASAVSEPAPANPSASSVPASAVSEPASANPSTSSVPASAVSEPAPANPSTSSVPASAVSEPAPANPSTSSVPASAVSEPAPENPSTSSVPDDYSGTIDLMSLAHDSDTDWLMDREEFNQLVNEKPFASPLTFIPNQRSPSLSKPDWCAPLSVNPNDDEDMTRLFGVLQQAIDNGLPFNKIGSVIYKVPYGLFIPTPGAFTHDQSPLSTRGEYFKNLIRNSSYLARLTGKPNQNFVTGRIVRVIKNNRDKLTIKSTGALNGFYLVTGSKFNLLYHGRPIRNTSSLIFDHDSVHGFLKR